MNKRKDEECMTTFLDAVIVNGVQDPGLTPFEEFLPRSAPLVDFCLLVCTLEQAGRIRLLTQFKESREIEVYPSRC